MWSGKTIPLTVLWDCRVQYLFVIWVPLNPGLGIVRDVASVSISHEQTQSIRVCSFQTLKAVFPNYLFLHYSLEWVLLITKITHLLKFYPINDLSTQMCFLNVTLNHLDLTKDSLTLISFIYIYGIKKHSTHQHKRLEYNFQQYPSNGLSTLNTFHNCPYKWVKWSIYSFILVKKMSESYSTKDLTIILVSVMNVTVTSSHTTQMTYLH